MPQGENFFNPYRWVPVSDRPVEHRAPAYRHCWQHNAGWLECTLTALTPLLIGDGKNAGEFIKSRSTNAPFIPGTSIKGMLRSLAELLGNACIPFPKDDHADVAHSLGEASRGQGHGWQLDIVARTFGFLDGGRVFSGLIRISDAHPVEPNLRPLPPTDVVVGQPRPQSHKVFYPQDKKARKFYHHHVGRTTLVPAPPEIKQTRPAKPLPPGTQFRFRVDFENLRDDELALLLYCLVLEDEVTVTLSPAALGRDDRQPQTLRGPMRHKLGACKPQGGGSVHIQVDAMRLFPQPALRYRGQSAAESQLTGDALRSEILRRTEPIRNRTDRTMQHLRAMLIYCSDDPRHDIRYPSRGWFQANKGTGTTLKPTL
jgi:CRISPR-associated protein Csm3